MAGGGGTPAPAAADASPLGSIEKKLLEGRVIEALGRRLMDRQNAVLEAWLVRHASVGIAAMADHIGDCAGDAENVFVVAQSGQPWEEWSYEPYIAFIGTNTSDLIRYAEPAGSRRTVIRIGSSSTRLAGTEADLVPALTQEQHVAADRVTPAKPVQGHAVAGAADVHCLYLARRGHLLAVLIVLGIVFAEPIVGAFAGAYRAVPGKLELTVLLRCVPVDGWLRVVQRDGGAGTQMAFTRALERIGRLQSAWLVERGTMPGQRVARLAEVDPELPWPAAVDGTREPHTNRPGKETQPNRERRPDAAGDDHPVAPPAVLQEPEGELGHASVHVDAADDPHPRPLVGPAFDGGTDGVAELFVDGAVTGPGRADRGLRIGGIEGHHWVHNMMNSLPGGLYGFLAMVSAAVFLLADMEAALTSARATVRVACAGRGGSSPRWER